MAFLSETGITTFINNAAQTDIQEKISPGSVYLGSNTSYSGADIKIVINLPDGGKPNNDRASSLQKDIKKTEDEIALVKKQSQIAQNKLPSTHQGTPDYETYSQTFRASNERFVELNNTLQSLQSQMKDVSLILSNVSTLVLAECQSLSISTFRDKKDVRACGCVYPKGFTRGSRTIAGSLVFTVFDQSVLWRILEAHPSDFDGNVFSSAILDQLPPVDIIITLANEYGSESIMTIFGVEFVSEGTVMSIEDLLTESTVQYVARDLDPMRARKSKIKKDNPSQMLKTAFTGTRATDLLNDPEYDTFQKNSAMDRFNLRRNPFL